jgi:small subunit ribosomal protein S19
VSFYKKSYIAPEFSRWDKRLDPTAKSVPVKTVHARSSIIRPAHVGLRFDIHMGNGYKRLIVTDDMVGHCFGEFAPTRRGAATKRGKKRR